MTIKRAAAGQQTSDQKSWWQHFRRRLHSKPAIAHLPDWMIGLAVTLCIISFSFIAPYGGLPSWLGNAVDADLAVRARILLGVEPLERLPVTIVDIDNATFSEWGQLAETPKKQLFDAIAAAAHRKPLAIVVDVDITASSSAEETDIALAKIAEYASKADNPPLILMRRLWFFDSDRAKSQVSSVTIPSYAPGISATNDKLAKIDVEVERAPNIIWSSPLHMSDDDGVTRHWRGVEALCNLAGVGTSRAFLAVPVIVAALGKVVDQPAPMPVAQIKHAAAQYSREQCSHPSAEVRFGDPRLREALGLERLGGRIPFAFYREIGAERAGFALDGRGERVPLVIVLPAGTVSRSESATQTAMASCDEPSGATTELSCDSFRGRVVLIGASHVDARDSYATPLGRVLGIDILASEIAGALDILPKKGNHPSALFWASLLFALFGRISSLLPPVQSTSLIVCLLTGFTAISGHFHVGAAVGYEAVALSLWMLGALLLFTPLLAAAWRAYLVCGIPFIDKRMRP